MTLRNRLILSVLGLIALLGLIIGLVSSIALNGFLMNRLDQQLTAATNRSITAVGPGPAGGPDPTVLVSINGQSAGTMVAGQSGGTVVTAVFVDALGATRPLSNEQLAILTSLHARRQPQSVELGGNLGEYRVAFEPLTLGNALIVGLPLAEVKATVTQLVLVTIIVTVAGLLVATFLGTLIIRLALRPLDRVVATAARVTSLQLDRGEVALAERVPVADTDPRTEVGRVGAALNKMLGHVSSALTSRQKSENKVRQFVADASHELRTPLASIRGYAELTRRGGYELPPDVSHSLGRIESEATRMTTLVEDLLLLARLDSQPELAAASVDLTALLVNAVSDAHVAAPDHEWALDLPEEPVSVDGDAPRLYQIVANLLANARVHTPPGTQVTAGLATGYDPDGNATAVITIADDGPGIDQELVPTLFERFVRGEASRFRQAGSTSTGLGLAIVKAVAVAHGGTVTVRSRPGDTVFTVILPVSAKKSAAAPDAAPPAPADSAATTDPATTE